MAPIALLSVSNKEGIVTFADEIQSDVLQNAKRFEEKLHKALGDLLDGTPAERRSGISRAGYSDELRDVNPEVAEFYIQNKTVFRPLFKSDVEMQQFVKEFQENKKVFEDLAAAGTRPDKELVTKANEAMAVEKKMLEELQTAISEGAMKQLYPNVPFKNRSEWGEALVKRDLAKAADLLYRQKIDDAAEWYAISPAKFVKNRYNQQGGTATPIDQRNKQMKGIGTEEFYGGPDSVDTKGKHYTSTVEKISTTRIDRSSWNAPLSCFCISLTLSVELTSSASCVSSKWSVSTSVEWCEIAVRFGCLFRTG